MTAMRKRTAGERIRAQRGQVNGQPQSNGHGPGPNTTPAEWSWHPISSADLVENSAPPTWLASRLLVAGQPAVIGGPQKVLKTSIAIDLAVSLASATPHLGRFAVHAARRVAILSGESGAWTLRETALRVCTARDLDLTTLSIVWQMDLPRLSVAADLDELGRGLADNGIEVALIDPLYLCLLAGQTGAQASSLYDMGPLLMRAGRACLDAGTTPVLLHHSTRPASRTREALELTDLAFSGIAEYSRQWLLLSRREAFEPGQPHRLWLNAGGSCGQGGLWAVDVDEGTLGDDFTGRRWEVEVRTAGEERGQRQDAARQEREGRRQETEAEQDRRLLEALDALDPDGQGAGLRQVRERAGMSDSAAVEALNRLRRSGLVEDMPDYRTTDGLGRRHAARGIRRAIEQG